MRTDLVVHAEVSATLRRELGAAVARVHVQVHDGVVTLTGTVGSPDQKRLAERAVQQVPGVRAVAEELHVPGAATGPLDDALLAEAVADALETECRGAGRQITVRVEDGWVALGGWVSSDADYAAIDRTLECLPGVRGVTSEVHVVRDGERFSPKG